MMRAKLVNEELKKENNKLTWDVDDQWPNEEIEWKYLSKGIKNIHKNGGFTTQTTNHLLKKFYNKKVSVGDFLNYYSNLNKKSSIKKLELIAQFLLKAANIKINYK